MRSDTFSLFAKMKCANLLFAIYKRYRRGLHLPFLESLLVRYGGSTEVNSVLDNQMDLYQGLFCGECRSFMEHIFDDSMKELTRRTYSCSTDVLNTLEFLQEVTATALWKYRFEIGPELEEFTRHFDRLDLDEDRSTLYARAQCRKESK